jgi:tRNA A37 threonylcarbamoyladenosine biosynthesis protein TsaE
MLKIKGRLPKFAKYLAFKLGIKQKIKLPTYTIYEGYIDDEYIRLCIEYKSVVLYFDDCLDILTEWSAIYWLSKKLGYVKQ